MRSLVPCFSLFLILLVTGCNLPQEPIATVDVVATGIAATLAPQPTQTPAAATVLPHSLAFLSHRGGSLQVWLLERDGVTLSQITNEATDVTAYDISRADGTVAFVVSNQLYLIDRDGSDRRLLVDNASADPNAADFAAKQRISAPRFSPDGRFLTYGYDGIWILDTTTNEAVHLIHNETEPLKLYTPIEWAPNSLQLLLNVATSDASTIAFVNPGAEPLITEVEARNVCCQVAWSPDSTSLVVAAPFVGSIETGLWRYNAFSGERTGLVESQADGLFQFAGWPLDLGGSLQYFYASSAEVPSGDPVLFMVRTGSDGQAERTQLRPDAFGQTGEVLWAPNGSLALVVQLGQDGVGGSVVLAYADERQLALLLDSAQGLRWGN